MTAYKWADLDRETLRSLLPGAVVVIAVGAVEQHGPHLPTGTDSLIAGVVTERAADRAGVPVIVAPAIVVGASDHHLPFGGTISLRPTTLLALIGDVLNCLAAAGARKVLLVNGHGGNSGLCHAAASEASSRLGIAVGHLDYWHLLPAAPGHAGEFETGLVRVIAPHLVGEVKPRNAPAVPYQVEGITMHSPEIWAAIDGFTDDPSQAEVARSRERLDHIIAALSTCMREFERSS
ncbi:creatininase family protein [Nonomuraea basaltis]|uniref:creatininase family protein n=1 Tax=Nonomuraea basaltis TaxID=2495887 RepID=UPI00110C5DD7|nr:creatininase family protein [Nonomuraea basaltis]TMR96562.1 creatininase family protein [Nonomuraea basaltis]